MRRLAILLILGASLSGCAAPQINPWQGLSIEMDPAANAVYCGEFPAPVAATESSITYDLDGVNELDMYRKCSDDNGQIANEHAAQIMHLKIARKALVEAGQSQRNIAVMKQEMLEDERKHHFWQSLGYWGLIIGMGLAL